MRLERIYVCWLDKNGVMQRAKGWQMWRPKPVPKDKPWASEAAK